MNTRNELFAKACAAVGSQADMARLLGVSPAMVNQMVEGVRPVPAKHCPSIERATNGEFPCEQLCPDVDWAYIRRSSHRPTKDAAHA